MDQLPRLGKRELICLLLFTCNYVVSVWRSFLFLWVLGMGYVILLWHSLSLPYNYSTISTYDFSTLYTTLPHNLIRNQLVDLIENTFRREKFFILPATKNVLFASEEHKKYDLWSCQKVTYALFYLLDNIYIIFGSKLYRQNVGIPMGTNCAPLVADLFLFCYERVFIKSLTNETRYNLIDVFNSTSRYLDELLNIDNITLNIWFTEYIPLNFN